MTKSNVLPVTKAEVVETNINYSAKIGKQVLKTQLKERLEVCRNNVTMAEANLHLLAQPFRVELEKRLKNQLQMCITNDGEISRFRNFLNKFTEEDIQDVKKSKSNWEFVDEHDVSSTLHALFGGGYSSAGTKMMRDDLFKEETLTFDLKLKAFAYMGSYDEPQHNPEKQVSVSYDLPIVKSELDTLRKVIEAEEVLATKHTEVNNVRTQLDSVDDLVERMEAKLLVDELASTEDGKKVLAVTSDLVTDMLGDTPELLQLGTK